MASRAYLGGVLHKERKQEGKMPQRHWVQNFFTHTMCIPRALIYFILSEVSPPNQTVIEMWQCLPNATVFVVKSPDNLSLATRIVAYLKHLNVPQAKLLNDTLQLSSNRGSI